MRNLLPSRNTAYLMRLFVCFTAFAILLSACSTAPTQQQDSAPKKPTLFEEIEENILNENFSKAEASLSSIQLNQLNQSDYLNYLLLSAQLHLAIHEADMSILFLEEAEPLVDSASTKQSNQYFLLSFQYLEAIGSYYHAAYQRDLLSHKLLNEHSDFNQQAVWLDLMRSTEEELIKGALQHSTSTQFGQWLELARIVRNNHLILDEQLERIESWQSRYPQHPAAKKLPFGLQQLLDSAHNRPNRLALVLPLSGPLEKTGKAIRDGFMAAYYDSLNKKFFTPEVHIYDSNQSGDLAAIYSQALFDGAQWVIGPVEKNKVQALSEQETLPLPTLALNYTEHEDETPPVEPKSNFFQFGLAAEDEATQIAERAWADGKRNALVLIPQGQWGERIYSAFEKRWLELGGNINDKRSYPTRQDYNPDVKALLNIDASQKRYNTLRMFFRDTVQFEPRRRQDADWIFLVALSQQARQIKPTLAFNFAGDLPVYATSHIFTGEINPTKDRDLNGIFYCDIPWLLKENNLNESVENALVSGQGSYVRLYAMGADTYRLVPQLNLLKAIPEYQLFGNTGALRLNEEQKIIRRSECTVFRNGRPLKISQR